MNHFEDQSAIKDGELAAAMEEERVLQSREMFYKPVSLHETPLFCADDRPNQYGEMYIHVFGGAANPVYNLRVVGEALEEGSSQGATFVGDTENTVPLLVGAGLKPGVHSQNETEGEGQQIHENHNEDIGCAYIKLRRDISQHAFKNRDALLTRAQRKVPELFSEPSDLDLANQILEAHGRMADNFAYFSSGRDVATAASKKGASTMNVFGEHSPQAAGIINFDSQTDLDSNDANDASLPAYAHNSGVTREIYRSLGRTEQRALEIADVLDALTVLDVLGVKEDDIAIRRPQAA